MRTLPAVLLVVLCAGAAAAQEGEERDFHRELKELIEAHEQALRRQGSQLHREATVLRELTAAAKALTLPQFDLARAEALAKLDEARRVAAIEPALPEPVPSVLEQVDQVLAEAWPQPGDQSRRRIFEAVRPLESHLWERYDAADRETDELRTEAAKIDGLPKTLQIPSRAIWSALREARREAMKTP